MALHCTKPGYSTYPYGLYAHMQLRSRNIKTFRRLIKEWGSENLRDFPWRHTRDPYEVAVAELMLRRTQAKQVVPVYRKFLEGYPTPSALADADPDEVRSVLRPLGLEWRAENIIEFGSAVVQKFAGTVPIEDSQLQQLPGVGPYVSAAVRCFAAGQAAAIVDTNTVRVVGRVYGISREGEARRRTKMKEAITRCVDPDAPRFYNFSLLDFASAVCTARESNHHICSFAKWRRCDYYRLVSS